MECLKRVFNNWEDALKYKRKFLPSGSINKCPEHGWAYHVEATNGGKRSLGVRRIRNKKYNKRRLAKKAVQPFIDTWENEGGSICG